MSAKDVLIAGYDADLELALTRLAAAEHLALSVEWLIEAIEKEKFFDAWHQVRAVRAELAKYRESGQENQHFSPREDK